MPELLPDRMGITTPLTGEDFTKHKLRRRSITSIIEWVQCFSVYLSVVCRTHPEKIPAMLAYLMLIIEASMEYEGNAWLGYDRRFRQAAAANPDTQWSRIDPTLWNLAFAGHAKKVRCTHCFSLTHKSSQCDWAPDLPSVSPTFNPRSWSYPQKDLKLKGICRSWNRDPRPGCSFPNCNFRHICSYCYNNPASTDKSHKSVFCPWRPQTPGTTNGSSHPVTVSPWKQ